MSQHSSSRAQAIVLAVAMLGLPAFVFGQPPAAQQPPAKAQAAAGETRRLSVNDAVQLALEQNLNIQVQRLSPQMQDLNVAQVRTAYTPNFSTTFSTSSTDSPVGSFLAGAATKLTQENFLANVSANQLFSWGGSYSVSWDSSRGKSNSLFSSPNPALRSTLNLNYTQPLVRNFKIDSVRQQLLITGKNREISDVQLRQTVLSTLRDVKNAYWELEYANQSLIVQRQSLDLARESLKNNQERVRIGTMAPIDIVEAQAEVAQREESVILAEAEVSRAEDRLRTLIYDPSTPGFWNLRLELTDHPAFDARPIDLEAAVRNALDKRTDLAQARKSLEASDINIRYFRNQALPDVSVQANYGLSGQGGTAIEYGSGFPPSIIGQSSTSYGSVLRTLLGNDFPSWTVGVTVGYPIGQSSAQAGLARAKLQYSQVQLQIRNTELQIASQVREAARQVNTNLKRVDATRASRELSEKRLEAEQKKFAAGMSTSFLVFQAQRDLAVARNSELRATLDYNQSLVDFETVQEAPIGVSAGSGLVVDTGAASLTGAATSAASTGVGSTAAQAQRQQ